jgi:hypothetical protein
VTRRTRALLLIVLCTLAACRREDPEARVVLRGRLTAGVGAVHSWTFTVPQAGPHRVLLEFPEPIENPDVAGLVERAERAADDASTPQQFDFSWQVLEGPNDLAQGKGPAGLRASDSTTGRSLVFGAFDARTGVSYRLRIVPEAQFQGLIAGKPAVVVQRR